MANNGSHRTLRSGRASNRRTSSLAPREHGAEGGRRGWRHSTGLPTRRETSQGAKGTALGRERHPSEAHQPLLACVQAQSVAAVRLAKERAVMSEWLLVEQQLGLMKHVIWRDATEEATRRYGGMGDRASKGVAVPAASTATGLCSVRRSRAGPGTGEGPRFDPDGTRHILPIHERYVRWFLHRDPIP